jgi:hypothetical protein
MIRNYFESRFMFAPNLEMGQLLEEDWPTTALDL